MRLIQRIWKYFITHGNERFSSPGEIKANRVLNMFLMVFFMLTSAVIGLEIFIYLHIIEQNAEVYGHYAYIYGPMPILSVFIIPSIYWLKRRFGSTGLYSVVFLALGMMYLSIFSVWIGKDSGVYLYLLAWFPLPFLLFGRKQWKILLGLELFMVIDITAVFWWVISHDPVFPLPINIEVIVLFFVLLQMMITYAFCNYYFWNVNTQAEEALIEKDLIIQQELDFAVDIQQGILPSDLSPWDGISFAVTYLPMSKVSGDYFDVFRSGDRVYLLLADISGHGVPAALITMLAKQTFSSLVETAEAPAQIFAKANHDLTKKIKTQDYLTAFLVRIDKEKKMSYSNASHNKPVYYNAAKKEFSLLDTEGFMIGALEEVDGSFKNGQLQLGPGDRLFLYTDGIIEQKNKAGAAFGLKRFYRILKENIDHPIETAQSEVLHEWLTFSTGVAKTDDITLVSLQVEG